MAAIADSGADTSPGTTATVVVYLGGIQVRPLLPGVPYLVLETEQPSSVLYFLPGFLPYVQAAVAVWAPCSTSAKYLAMVARRWVGALLWGRGGLWVVGGGATIALACASAGAGLRRCVGIV
jgi:hypothetical protein